jgi:hypothetical protein
MPADEFRDLPMRALAAVHKRTVTEPLQYLLGRDLTVVVK